MKTPQKLAAGWLITMGFMFLMVTASAVVNQPATHRRIRGHPFMWERLLDRKLLEENRDAATGGLMLGVPSLLTGGWLALAIYGQDKKEKRDRLNSTFYHLLKQGKGYISVLNFAMATQLPAAAAKKYLNEQAKEFNATFNVNDMGGIFYHFHDFSTFSSVDSAVFPSVTPTINFWTLGSTRDDVLRVQGTPTKISEWGVLDQEVFYYGSSTVKIVKNLVAEYNNCDNNLKVFVEADS